MSDPIQPYGITPAPAPLLNPVSEWKLQDGTLFNTAFGFSIDSFAPTEPDLAKDALSQRLLAFLNAPAGRCADSADEVMAYLRKRRGNAFLAAAVELLDSRAATVAALTMRADSADRTAEALTAEARLMRAATFAATARAEKAEAEKAEQWAYANDFRAMLDASQRDCGVMQVRAETAEATVLEARKELTYTRQMFQETEDAMVKLASRVKEQQAELAEQEAAKWELVKELGSRAA